MNCKNCRWFQERRLDFSEAEGDCRVRAPVRLQKCYDQGGESFPVDGWPRVRKDDFCGEFETKQPGRPGR